MMSREPGAMQLRYLQSMREIASERSSMTILPIPIDLLSPFVEMAKRFNSDHAQRDQKEQPATPTVAPSVNTPETILAPGNGVSSLPAGTLVDEKLLLPNALTDTIPIERPLSS